MSVAQRHLQASTAKKDLTDWPCDKLQRIILDIHDGPVQKLFAALSQVNLLQARASQGQATHQEVLACLNRVSELLETFIFQAALLR